MCVCVNVDVYMQESCVDTVRSTVKVTITVFIQVPAQCRDPVPDPVPVRHSIAEIPCANSQIGLPRLSPPLIPRTSSIAGIPILILGADPLGWSLAAVPVPQPHNVSATTSVPTVVSHSPMLALGLARSVRAVD